MWKCLQSYLFLFIFFQIFPWAKVFSLSLFFKECVPFHYYILFFSIQKLILSLSAEGRRPDGSCKNRDERQ